MSIAALVSKCAEQNAPAWVTLWKIVDSAGRGPIRRALQAAGMDYGLADDVLQDFYLYLERTHLRCLLAVFADDTDAQFTHFLGRVVSRFAIRETSRWHRDRDREIEAIRCLPLQERGGPSEGKIVALVQGLAEQMGARDRHRFQVLASLSPTLAATAFAKCAATGAVPPRTLRRWRRALLARYADQLLDLAGLG